MKDEGDCCKLPLKATEEDKEGTASCKTMAAAKVISQDAAVEAFLLELDGLVELNTLEALSLVLTHLSMSLAKHSSASRLTTGRRYMYRVTPQTNKKSHAEDICPL